MNAIANAAYRPSPLQSSFSSAALAAASPGLRNAIYSATAVTSTARGYFQRHAEARAKQGLAVGPGKPFVPTRRGTTSEAARILGCSPSLVRWLIRMGELQNVERPGKRMYLLDLDEVHRYRLRRMEERI